MDLSTLWYLTTGTLLLSAAMTFWEMQGHIRRSRELGIWAGSYVVFACGCVIAMNRHHLPGASGAALTNIVMVLGYLMFLYGAARLDGSPRIWPSPAALAALTLVWVVAGGSFAKSFWHYLASLPIALACGLTAWTLLRSRVVRGLRSRPVAVAVFAGHAAFYLVRALVNPVLVAIHGDELLPALAKTTMYEAALYSVAMPMALLALVREEAQGLILEASRTDYLTGLPNRHGFFEHAARVLAEQGSDRPISLLAFDLDHFKTINDRHGHAGGDAVLILFATVMRDTTGPEAMLVRLGGEEFAALLPGRDVGAAGQIGERIRQRFAEAVSRNDGPGISATVSIGLAETRSGGGALSELLSKADGALYRAKALGRNRVELAETAYIAAA